MKHNKSPWHAAYYGNRFAVARYVGSHIEYDGGADGSVPKVLYASVREAAGRARRLNQVRRKRATA